LKAKWARYKADARDKANKVLADLRKKRDDFRDIVKRQSESNEAAWISAKAQLESEWSSFEAEVKKYVENFAQQIEQQQATFSLQAAAQMNAWREAVDKLGSVANEFAAERRGEIDATLQRMKADAEAAEANSKTGSSGAQSWSVLIALTEHASFVAIRRCGRNSRVA
jgi:hypothetical protein